MANIGSAPHGKNHEVGLIVQSSTGIRTDPVVELYADPTTHRLLVDAGTVSGAGTIGSAVPTSAEYLGVAVGTILKGLSGKGLGLNVAADVAVVDQNGNQINSLPGALDVNLKQVSPFVTRNGPSFNLKGQKFRFVGFNYYPLIIGSTKAQMQTLMDDAKAKGITVLRTWCFDPYGAFRQLIYPLGTNLITTDPSFESGTSGWTVDTDLSRVNTDAQDGSWSMKQVSTGGFSYLDRVITVIANADYVWTFWYKSSNPSGNPSVAFVGTTAHNNDVFDGGFNYDTNGTWQKKQVVFNSGANTTLHISVLNFGGTVTAFYDNFNVSLKSGTPHLEYVESKLLQIDTALDEARKRGIKLILDLADGNENGYNTKGQYVTWANAINNAGLTNSYPYIGFYQSTYCKNIYKDFINTLVNRKNTINGIQYKDDPAIFSWELGNELRVNNFDPGNTVNTLQSGNLALLSNPGGWADEMSTYIKSIDPNHMVNFGDMGHSWQYLQDGSAVGDVVFNGSFYGVDYGILSALPNIDFADYHLYPTQDDGIHLAAGSGKYWGQKFGYNNGVSGDGLRAQLKDYVTTAHANNKPAVITEVGFLQGTTGDNTYYPLYNRYNAFKAIFTDFLDIPNGDGVVIWHAVAAATSLSYDIALEATGGAGVTDNSNDTDILTLINTYNTAFLTDVTPSQAVTGLIKVNGDIVSKNLNFNDSTVSIQLSDTWTGTVQFEYTIDGITWYSLSLKDNTGTAVTSATAVGLFSGSVAGMNKVRVRASASITGSLTVNIQSSTGVNASTSSGGGTQYANGAAQATPTGTVALGYDGANVRALSTDTSGHLVLGAGTNTIGLVKITDGTTVPDVANNPSDAQTNSSKALNVIGLTSVFNGLNWDRLKGDSTNGAYVNIKSSITLTTNATLQTQADTTMVGGVNIKEINAVTPLMGNGATGTGSLRVTPSNDSTGIANWGHGATGSAVPSGAQYDGGIAKTSLPTATTDGQLTGKMVDKFGRQVVMLNGMRDIILPMTQLTLTSTTTETTLIAQVASTFLDITSIIVINTSAIATQVDFRDSTGGTIRRSLYIPAGDTRGFTNDFVQQNTVNNNWTAKCVTSVASIIITGTYITNK